MLKKTYSKNWKVQAISRTPLASVSLSSSVETLLLTILLRQFVFILDFIGLAVSRRKTFGRQILDLWHRFFRSKEKLRVLSFFICVPCSYSPLEMLILCFRLVLSIRIVCHFSWMCNNYIVILMLYTSNDLCCCWITFYLFVYPFPSGYLIFTYLQQVRLEIRFCILRTLENSWDL